MKLSIYVALCFLSLGKVPLKAQASSPVLNPENGHYYEVIQTDGLPEVDRSIELALSESSSKSFQGLPGYLVTITSAAEQEFLQVQFGDTGRLWIAASDAEVEGEWRWIAGPEAGQLFWLGDNIGTAIGFANWPPSEPNNTMWQPEGEDYAIFNWTAAGIWNDMPQNRNDLLRGYIVEYSVIPEPSTWLLATWGILSAVGLAACRRIFSPSP